VREGISAFHFAGVPKPWLFTNQMCGGCWPSPHLIYKKYLPYKESYLLSKMLLGAQNELFNSFKQVVNEFFGVNLICVEKTVSDIELFLESQKQQTQSTTTSQFYFVEVGNKIVINNTGQPDEIVKDIHQNQPDKADGIFYISVKDEHIHIKRKNLFDLDHLVFPSKESEVNFQKIILAYVFLEYLC
jgi:hypothetical protein